MMSLSNKPRRAAKSAIIEEERKMFLRRINAHTLSTKEYAQGKRVEPLKIQAQEIITCIARGIIITRKYKRPAPASQMVLQVSYQDEPLQISITESGVVKLHLIEEEKEDAQKKDSARPSGELSEAKNVTNGILERFRKSTLGILLGKLFG
jgi:hypothetical protein